MIAVQVRGDVIPAPAPQTRPQGGLEAGAVGALDAAEGFLFPFVLGRLGFAQPHPPLLPGGVEALRPFPLEKLADRVSLFFVLRESDEHGPALPQRVFVEVELVFRQAAEKAVLESVARRRARQGAAGPEQRRRGEADRGHGTDTGDQQAGGRLRQPEARGGPEDAADDAPHGLAHTGLLGLCRGDRMDLAFRRTRSSAA